MNATTYASRSTKNVDPAVEELIKVLYKYSTSGQEEATEEKETPSTSTFILPPAAYAAARAAMLKIMIDRLKDLLDKILPGPTFPNPEEEDDDVIITFFIPIVVAIIAAGGAVGSAYLSRDKDCKTVTNEMKEYDAQGNVVKTTTVVTKTCN